ncbi:hypothetical protein K8B33_07025 [Alcanivorax sp. JB21]|uniref:hypothetical protein n=1 Tax=Alcanivorax limicola TaxID=2874102 RepID=UPI001CBD47FF|nr:hypothetical protein [Alcanivorax limicola]MBZ2188842.1 hypothetical protein [Alcanivorax limicola]
MDSIFRFINEFQPENFYSVLNSQFASSILGALLGAFAGAFAAHKIALNAKKREELEQQIRGLNVALSTAFLICNSALSLKSQHIESSYKKFTADRKSYEDALKQPPAGGVIQFETDLKTLHMPYLPLEVLEKNAYERITIKGRPLALISTIANSVEALRNSLDHRNNLIEKFKGLFPTIPNKDRLDYYFGFPLPGGRVHQEFLNTMEGIYQYADDVIFFSSLLCEDLKKYGEGIRKIYKEKYDKKVENIVGFDFKTPKAVAIWPDEENYKDWMEMFVEQEEVLPWYRRIFSTNKPKQSDE